MTVINKQFVVNSWSLIKNNPQEIKTVFSELLVQGGSNDFKGFINADTALDVCDYLIRFTSNTILNINNLTFFPMAKEVAEKFVELSIPKESVTHLIPSLIKAYELRFFKTLNAMPTYDSEVIKSAFGYSNSLSEIHTNSESEKDSFVEWNEDLIAAWNGLLNSMMDATISFYDTFDLSTSISEENINNSEKASLIKNEISSVGFDTVDTVANDSLNKSSKNPMKPVSLKNDDSDSDSDFDSVSRSGALHMVFKNAVDNDDDPFDTESSLPNSQRSSHTEATMGSPNPDSPNKSPSPLPPSPSSPTSSQSKHSPSTKTDQPSNSNKPSSRTPSVTASQATKLPQTKATSSASSALGSNSKISNLESGSIPVTDDPSQYHILRQPQHVQNLVDSWALVTSPRYRLLFLSAFDTFFRHPDTQVQELISSLSYWIDIPPSQVLVNSNHELINIPTIPSNNHDPSNPSILSGFSSPTVDSSHGSLSLDICMEPLQAGLLYYLRMMNATIAILKYLVLDLNPEDPVISRQYCHRRHSQEKYTIDRSNGHISDIPSWRRESSCFGNRSLMEAMVSAIYIPLAPDPTKPPPDNPFLDIPSPFPSSSSFGSKLVDSKNTNQQVQYDDDEDLYDFDSEFDSEDEDEYEGDDEDDEDEYEDEEEEDTLKKGKNRKRKYISYDLFDLGDGTFERVPRRFVRPCRGVRDEDGRLDFPSTFHSFNPLCGGKLHDMAGPEKRGGIAEVIDVDYQNLFSIHPILLPLQMDSEEGDESEGSEDTKTVGGAPHTLTPYTLTCESDSNSSLSSNSLDSIDLSNNSSIDSSDPSASSVVQKQLPIEDNKNMIVTIDSVDASFIQYCQEVSDNEWLHHPDPPVHFLPKSSHNHMFPRALLNLVHGYGARLLINGCVLNDITSINVSDAVESEAEIDGIHGNTVIDVSSNMDAFSVAMARALRLVLMMDHAHKNKDMSNNINSISFQWSSLYAPVWRSYLASMMFFTCEGAANYVRMEHLKRGAMALKRSWSTVTGFYVGFENSPGMTPDLDNQNQLTSPVDPNYYRVAKPNVFSHNVQVMIDDQEEDHYLQGYDRFAVFSKRWADLMRHDCLDSIGHFRKITDGTVRSFWSFTASNAQLQKTAVWVLQRLSVIILHIDVLYSLDDTTPAARQVYHSISALYHHTRVHTANKSVWKNISISLRNSIRTSLEVTLTGPVLRSWSLLLDLIGAFLDLHPTYSASEYNRLKDTRDVVLVTDSVLREYDEYTVGGQLVDSDPLSILQPDFSKHSELLSNSTNPDSPNDSLVSLDSSTNESLMAYVNSREYYFMDVDTVPISIWTDDQDLQVMFLQNSTIHDSSGWTNAGIADYSVGDNQGKSVDYFGHVLPYSEDPNHSVVGEPYDPPVHTVPSVRTGISEKNITTGTSEDTVENSEPSKTTEPLTSEKTTKSAKPTNNVSVINVRNDISYRLHLLSASLHKIIVWRESNDLASLLMGRLVAVAPNLVRLADAYNVTNLARNATPMDPNVMFRPPQYPTNITIDSLLLSLPTSQSHNIHHSLHHAFYILCLCISTPVDQWHVLYCALEEWAYRLYRDRPNSPYFVFPLDTEARANLDALPIADVFFGTEYSRSFNPNSYSQRQKETVRLNPKSNPSTNHNNVIAPNLHPTYHDLPVIERQPWEEAPLFIDPYVPASVFSRANPCITTMLWGFMMAHEPSLSSSSNKPQTSTSTSGIDISDISINHDKEKLYQNRDAMVWSSDVEHAWKWLFCWVSDVVVEGRRRALHHIAMGGSSSGLEIGYIRQFKTLREKQNRIRRLLEAELDLIDLGHLDSLPVDDSDSSESSDDGEIDILLEDKIFYMKHLDSQKQDRKDSKTDYSHRDSIIQPSTSIPSLSDFRSSHVYSHRSQRSSQNSSKRKRDDSIRISSSSVVSNSSRSSRSSSSSNSSQDSNNSSRRSSNNSVTVEDDGSDNSISHSPPSFNADFDPLRSSKLQTDRNSSKRQSGIQDLRSILNGSSDNNSSDVDVMESKKQYFLSTQQSEDKINSDMSVINNLTVLASDRSAIAGVFNILAGNPSVAPTRIFMGSDDEPPHLDELPPHPLARFLLDPELYHSLALEFREFNGMKSSMPTNVANITNITNIIEDEKVRTIIGGVNRSVPANYSEDSFFIAPLIGWSPCGRVQINATGPPVASTFVHLPSLPPYPHKNDAYIPNSTDIDADIYCPPNAFAPYADYIHPTSEEHIASMKGKQSPYHPWYFPSTHKYMKSNRVEENSGVPILWYHPGQVCVEGGQKYLRSVKVSNDFSLSYLFHCGTPLIIHAPSHGLIGLYADFFPLLRASADHVHQLVRYSTSLAGQLLNNIFNTPHPHTSFEQSLIHNSQLHADTMDYVRRGYIDDDDYLRDKFMNHESEADMSYDPFDHLEKRKPQSRIYGLGSNQRDGGRDGELEEDPVLLHALFYGGQTLLSDSDSRSYPLHHPLCSFILPPPQWRPRCHMMYQSASYPINPEYDIFHFLPKLADLPLAYNGTGARLDVYGDLLSTEHSIIEDDMTNGGLDVRTRRHSLFALQLIHDGHVPHSLTSFPWPYLDDPRLENAPRVSSTPYGEHHDVYPENMSDHQLRMEALLLSADARNHDAITLARLRNISLQNNVPLTSETVDRLDPQRECVFDVAAHNPPIRYKLSVVELDQLHEDDELRHENHHYVVFGGSKEHYLAYLKMKKWESNIYTREKIIKKKLELISEIESQKRRSTAKTGKTHDSSSQGEGIDNPEKENEQRRGGSFKSKRNSSEKRRLNSKRDKSYKKNQTDREPVYDFTFGNFDGKRRHTTQPAKYVSPHDLGALYSSQLEWIRTRRNRSRALVRRQVNLSQGIPYGTIDVLIQRQTFEAEGLDITSLFGTHPVVPVPLFPDPSDPLPPVPVRSSRPASQDFQGVHPGLDQGEQNKRYEEYLGSIDYPVTPTPPIFQQISSSPITRLSTDSSRYTASIDIIPVVSGRLTRGEYHGALLEVPSAFVQYPVSHTIMNVSSPLEFVGLQNSDGPIENAFGVMDHDSTRNNKSEINSIGKYNYNRYYKNNGPKMTDAAGNTSSEGRAAIKRNKTLFEHEDDFEVETRYIVFGGDGDIYSRPPLSPPFAPPRVYSPRNFNLHSRHAYMPQIRRGSSHTVVAPSMSSVPSKYLPSVPLYYRCIIPLSMYPSHSYQPLPCLRDSVPLKKDYLHPYTYSPPHFSAALLFFRSLASSVCSRSNRAARMQNTIQRTVAGTSYGDTKSLALTCPHPLPKSLVNVDIRVLKTTAKTAGCPYFSDYVSSMSDQNAAVDKSLDEGSWNHTSFCFSFVQLQHQFRKLVLFRLTPLVDSLNNYCSQMHVFHSVMAKYSQHRGLDVNPDTNQVKGLFTPYNRVEALKVLPYWSMEDDRVADLPCGSILDSILAIYIDACDLFNDPFTNNSVSLFDLNRMVFNNSNNIQHSPLTPLLTDLLRRCRTLIFSGINASVFSALSMYVLLSLVVVNYLRYPNSADIDSYLASYGISIDPQGKISYHTTISDSSKEYQQNKIFCNPEIISADIKSHVLSLSDEISMFDDRPRSFIGNGTVSSIHFIHSYIKLLLQRLSFLQNSISTAFPQVQKVMQTILPLRVAHSSLWASSPSIITNLLLQPASIPPPSILAAIQITWPLIRRVLLQCSDPVWQSYFALHPNMRLITQNVDLLKHSAAFIVLIAQTFGLPLRITDVDDYGDPTISNSDPSSQAQFVLVSHTTWLNRIKELEQCGARHMLYYGIGPDTYGSFVYSLLTMCKFLLSSQWTTQLDVTNVFYRPGSLSHIQHVKMASFQAYNRYPRLCEAWEAAFIFMGTCLREGAIVSLRHPPHELPGETYLNYVYTQENAHHVESIHKEMNMHKLSSNNTTTAGSELPPDIMMRCPHFFRDSLYPGSSLHDGNEDEEEEDEDDNDSDDADDQVAKSPEFYTNHNQYTANSPRTALMNKLDADAEIAEQKKKNRNVVKVKVKKVKKVIKSRTSMKSPGTKHTPKPTSPGLKNAINQSSKMVATGDKNEDKEDETKKVLEDIIILPSGLSSVSRIMESSKHGILAQKDSFNSRVSINEIVVDPLQFSNSSTPVEIDPVGIAAHAFQSASTLPSLDILSGIKDGSLQRMNLETAVEYLSLFVTPGKCPVVWGIDREVETGEEQGVCIGDGPYPIELDSLSFSSSPSFVRTPHDMYHQNTGSDTCTSQYQNHNNTSTCPYQSKIKKYQREDILSGWAHPLRPHYLQKVYADWNQVVPDEKSIESDDENDDEEELARKYDALHSNSFRKYDIRHSSVWSVLPTASMMKAESRIAGITTGVKMKEQKSEKKEETSSSDSEMTQKEDVRLGEYFKRFLLRHLFQMDPRTVEAFAGRQLDRHTLTIVESVDFLIQQMNLNTTLSKFISVAALRTRMRLIERSTSTFVALRGVEMEIPVMSRFMNDTNTVSSTLGITPRTYTQDSVESLKGRMTLETHLSNLGTSHIRYAMKRSFYQAFESSLMCSVKNLYSIIDRMRRKDARRKIRREERKLRLNGNLSIAEDEAGLHKDETQHMSYQYNGVHAARHRKKTIMLKKQAATIYGRFSGPLDQNLDEELQQTEFNPLSVNHLEDLPQSPAVHKIESYRTAYSNRLNKEACLFPSDPPDTIPDVNNLDRAFNRRMSLAVDVWNRVSRMARATGRNFYAHMMKISEEIRNLFKGRQLENVERAFVSTIGYTIENLSSQPADVVLHLRSLGARHVSFNIGPEAFELHSVVFVQTVKKAFGVDWNDQLERALCWVMDLIIVSMLEGMVEEEQRLSAAQARMNIVEQVEAGWSSIQPNLHKHARKVLTMSEMNCSSVRSAYEKAVVELKKYHLQHALPNLPDITYLQHLVKESHESVARLWSFIARTARQIASPLVKTTHEDAYTDFSDVIWSSNTKDKCSQLKVEVVQIAVISLYRSMMQKFGFSLVDLYSMADAFLDIVHESIIPQLTPVNENGQAITGNLTVAQIHNLNNIHVDKSGLSAATAWVWIVQRIVNTVATHVAAEDETSRLNSSSILLRAAIDKAYPATKPVVSLYYKHIPSYIPPTNDYMLKLAHELAVKLPMLAAMAEMHGIFTTRLSTLFNIFKQQAIRLELNTFETFDQVNTHIDLPVLNGVDKKIIYPRGSLVQLTCIFLITSAYPEISLMIRHPTNLQQKSTIKSTKPKHRYLDIHSFIPKPRSQEGLERRRQALLKLFGRHNFHTQLELIWEAVLSQSYSPESSCKNDVSLIAQRLAGLNVHNSVFVVEPTHRAPTNLYRTEQFDGFFDSLGVPRSVLYDHNWMDPASMGRGSRLDQESIIRDRLERERARDQDREYRRLRGRAMTNQTNFHDFSIVSEMVVQNQAQQQRINERDAIGPWLLCCMSAALRQILGAVWGRKESDTFFWLCSNYVFPWLHDGIQNCDRQWLFSQESWAWFCRYITYYMTSYSRPRHHIAQTLAITLSHFTENPSSKNNTLFHMLQRTVSSIHASQKLSSIFFMPFRAGPTFRVNSHLSFLIARCLKVIEIDQESAYIQLTLSPELIGAHKDANVGFLKQYYHQNHPLMCMHTFNTTVLEHMFTTPSIDLLLPSFSLSSYMYTGDSRLVIPNPEVNYHNHTIMKYRLKSPQSQRYSSLPGVKQVNYLGGVNPELNPFISHNHSPNYDYNYNHHFCSVGPRPPVGNKVNIQLIFSNPCLRRVVEIAQVRSEYASLDASRNEVKIKRNADGYIIDSEGNVVDEQGNIIGDEEDDEDGVSPLYIEHQEKEKDQILRIETSGLADVDPMENYEDHSHIHTFLPPSLPSLPHSIKLKDNTILPLEGINVALPIAHDSLIINSLLPRRVLDNSSYGFDSPLTPNVPGRLPIVPGCTFGLTDTYLASIAAIFPPHDTLSKSRILSRMNIEEEAHIHGDLSSDDEEDDERTHRSLMNPNLLRPNANQKSSTSKKKKVDVYDKHAQDNSKNDEIGQQREQDFRDDSEIDILFGYRSSAPPFYRPLPPFVVLPRSFATITFGKGVLPVLSMLASLTVTRERPIRSNYAHPVDILYSLAMRINRRRATEAFISTMAVGVQAYHLDYISPVGYQTALSTYSSKGIDIDDLPNHIANSMNEIDSPVLPPVGCVKVTCAALLNQHCRLLRNSYDLISIKERLDQVSLIEKHDKASYHDDEDDDEDDGDLDDVAAYQAYKRKYGLKQKISHIKYFDEDGSKSKRRGDGDGNRRYSKSTPKSHSITITSGLKDTTILQDEEEFDTHSLEVDTDDEEEVIKTSSSVIIHLSTGEVTVADHNMTDVLLGSPENDVNPESLSSRDTLPLLPVPRWLEPLVYLVTSTERHYPPLLLPEYNFPEGNRIVHVHRCKNKLTTTCLPDALQIAQAIPTLFSESSLRNRNDCILAGQYYSEGDVADVRKFSNFEFEHLPVWVNQYVFVGGPLFFVRYILTSLFMLGVPRSRIVVHVVPCDQDPSLEEVMTHIPDVLNRL